MTQWINAWNKTKKTIRFMWRYGFTIGAFSLLLLVPMNGQAVDWSMFFTELSIALCLDLFRKKANAINRQHFHAMRYSTGSAHNFQQPPSLNNNPHQTHATYPSHHFEPSYSQSTIDYGPSWNDNAFAVGSTAWNNNTSNVGSIAWHNNSMNIGSMASQSYSIASPSPSISNNHTTF